MPDPSARQDSRSAASDRPIRFGRRRWFLPPVLIVALLWLSPFLFSLALCVYGWTAGLAQRLLFPETVGGEQAGAWALELAALYPGLSVLDCAILAAVVGLLVRLGVRRVTQRARRKHGGDADAEAIDH